MRVYTISTIHCHWATDAEVQDVIEAQVMFVGGEAKDISDELYKGKENKPIKVVRIACEAVEVTVFHHNYPAENIPASLHNAGIPS